MNGIGGMRLFTPLLVILAFLVLTLLLYNFGPVEWEAGKHDLVSIYLLFNWAFLAVGYYIATRLGPASSGKIGVGIVLLGLVCNAITIVPTIHMYTGKYPWDVALYSVSQGERYNDYQNYLSMAASQGGVVRMIQGFSRSVLQPFIYAGIVIGVKYWKSLSMMQRLFVITSIALQVVFSISRGTDKEIVDLFIFILVPFYLFHSSLKTGSIRKLLVMLLVTIAVVSVFSERRISRYGGIVPDCFSYAEICVDYTSDVANTVPKPTYFTFAILSSYLTQGYNGLSLAMDLDYEFSYGIGHAAILMRLFDRFTGINVFENTYTYRLGTLGWDSRYLWSSLYTWLANDVSFKFVFVVFLLLGGLFGMAARDAIKGGDDYGLIVLVFIILLLVYSPANNQLAVSLDMYFSWIFWLFLWLARKAIK